MPNWACEFDSHLGHRKTEVDDYVSLRFLLVPSASLLPAEPFVEDVVVAELPIGSGVRGLGQSLQAMIRFPFR